VVSSVEEVVLTTLEELANTLEREDEPPLFQGGEGGNPLLSSSTSSGIG